VYSFKILILGPFNAGKTTLVQTLSEISMTTEREITRPEERAKKTKTTVAMDFGIVNLGDGYVVRLFGTPGQRRFSFMWRVLSKGIHGYILIIDSTDEESIMEAIRIHENFREEHRDVPYVIAANKQDLPGAMSALDIRLALDVPDEVPVIPTIATNHQSAWNVLSTLLERCITKWKIVI